MCVVAVHLAKCLKNNPPIHTAYLPTYMHVCGPILLLVKSLRIPAGLTLTVLDLELLNNPTTTSL